MTSDRRQTVLKLVSANRAQSVGDVWTHEAADERVRLYWPAGILVRSETGEPVIANPDWAEAYEAGRRAFLAQATALASLSHPNVGTIRTISDLDDLAVVRTTPMGVSLAARLGGGAVVRPKAVLALAADLAAGLEAIHARGQLHLNLAPNSIGVGTGRAVLYDPSVDRRRFIPLVRRLDGLFRPGLAPFEAQDATESAPLVPATDLYGLCAVLYRVITGRDAPDWFGWTDETRLSARPEAADYPTAFIAAVETGLSRNAADRFATVGDWRAVAGLAEAPPLEGRVWFDAVEDLNVPPTPPDDLALAPPPVKPDPAPVVEDLGALRPTPTPEMLSYKFGSIPSGGKPGHRVGRNRAIGVGVMAAAAGLVAVMAFAGGRFSGARPGTGPADAEAEAVSARREPPKAPDGCSWTEGEDESDLTLRCGSGEGQVVDRGTLRPGDVADATAGQSAAMTRLGAFYLRDTPGRDEQAGLEWLRRAASAGETSAMLDLGDFYEVSAGEESGSPAVLRQSLDWYRMVNAPAAEGSSARIPSPDQIRLADEGALRIEARLVQARDGAFAGCWRSGEITARLTIKDDRFAFAVGDGEPAVGQIAEPREDDRLLVTLDGPKLMTGQRYLLTRDGDELVERRLDVANSVERWTACSAD
ncbi:SEL1-like repeat-containing protein kinase family protein [Brevundimonas goettingensis]|uniref:SEL1-like repeat protein n=1 Tax=Brevundimonas goettingensis TaxID=2774190 RepID=A0A975C2G2_9CAUL|nr:SEL1-like repeat protein [Brevundimonas goettingensis]QTC92285.1 SEL1-like repeat protein [Brevundimonas goettingensis]